MLVWNKQWEMQSVRAFSGVWWAYSCLWIYFQYTEMLDFSYSSITLWTSQQLLWILSLDHVGFSGLVGWGRQGRHGITSSWGDSSCKGPLEVIQHQDTPRPGGWPCRVKPGLCPSMEIPWYLCDLSFIGIFFFPLVSNKDFSHVRWCSIISSDRVPSIPRATTQCNGEITALTCLHGVQGVLFATREHRWLPFSLVFISFCTAAFQPSDTKVWHGGILGR